MHLGKKLKLNTIIAILLCMAFVVNFGTTWALTSYSFKAKGVIGSGSANTETYTEYASAQATSGKYVYSVGNNANQLGIDYGFSTEHDLMVKFTATYSNEAHDANDFSLNFVNRDNWCVDVSTVTGLAAANGNAQQFYTTTSSSNSISGVMYYIGTLQGSGTLPLLSSVTFYTSPNNSYNYMGDVLTVSLTPVYVKTGSNYNNHSFASEKFSSNTTAYDNWVAYMNENTSMASAKHMVYNAYATSQTALQFPSDYDWSANDFNISQQNEKVYSNTAYRYAVNKIVNGDKASTSRTYSALASGNKYYGGVGVHVLPNSSLTTVSIGVGYYWQKNGAVDVSIPINMVQLEYSSDITTLERTIVDDPATDDVESGIYYTHYYRANISAPTYINVLDYIMLTAESPASLILSQGYSLVITGVSVSVENSNPSGWISNARPGYEVDNATQQSPVLVRIKDVATGSQSQETNVSVRNNSKNSLAITSFTVKAKLWYADYTSNTSAFNEIMVGYLPDHCLTYDASIWAVQYSGDTYTFTRHATTAYIAPGYSMKLIKGVTIPQQYYPTENDAGFTEIKDAQNNVIGYETIYVNDLWCSLDVTITGAATVSNYAGGTSTNTEVVATGYYSAIDANGYAYIYLRNNTQQNISYVNITALRLSALGTSTTLLPRDNLNTSTSFTYTLTNHLTGVTETGVSATSNKSITGSVQVRPNETLLVATIKPSVKSVIYTYQSSVTLVANAESDDVDLMFNSYTQNGNLVNNSDTNYEFRLSSNVDLSDYLVNSGEFVEQIVEDATTTYYYYYKGVICAHQFIVVIQNLTNNRNIVVQAIAHTDGATADTYVADNYTTWAPPADWLSAMQLIYGEPVRN